MSWRAAMEVRSLVMEARGKMVCRSMGVSAPGTMLELPKGLA